MSDGERELDLVVYGATGFVGRLVAEHLAAHAPEGTRIGLGGRSRGRLETVRAALPARAAAWPLVVADAGDREALAAMAARATAVATTVGPYARYGAPLVEACARGGTHYADLTGEVLFVRESIDRCHDLAAASGARIVHSCGFDSVPSDLGVLLTAEQAAADDAGPLEDTTLVVTTLRGGVSGGTIDSLRGQIDAVRAQPALWAVVEDPYALSPTRAAEPDLGDERDVVAAGRDDELGMWVGPFVMAPYNTRIVRRSNALQHWAYGRRFHYREVMGFGTGLAAPALATSMAVGVRAALLGMQLGPTRMVLDRLLPAPGSGPGEGTRRRGRFRMDLRARTATGRRFRTVVAAQGDPGYAATAVMMGQAGLALALDGPRLPQRAGVLTPATGIGMPLVHRLRAHGFELTTTAL